MVDEKRIVASNQCPHEAGDPESLQHPLTYGCHGMLQIDSPLKLLNLKHLHVFFLNLIFDVLLITETTWRAVNK